METILLSQVSKLAFRQVRIRPWVAFWVIALFMTLPEFTASLRTADQFDNQTPPTAAPRLWLEVANCARATGLLLVKCTPEGVAPIAGPDDNGHALILGLYAIVKDRQIVSSDISRANTVLNYTGILLIASLLLSLGATPAALLVLAAGGMIASPSHGLFEAEMSGSLGMTGYPGSLGAACLSAILPVTLMSRVFNSKPQRAWGILLIVGFGGVAAAMLIREPIGLMGVVASALALITYSIVRLRTWRQLSATILLGFSLLVAASFPEMATGIRNIMHPFPTTQLGSRHGVGHALYLGLGVVPNQFGIEWSDDFATKQWTSRNSVDSVYTDAYFDSMKGLYWDAVFSNPFEVMRIYQAKLSMALRTVWSNVSLIEALSGVSIVTAIMLTMALVLGVRVRQLYAPQLVAGVFVVMFLVQAAAIHPHPLYLYPSIFFIFMLGCLAVEIAFRVFVASVQAYCFPRPVASIRRPDSPLSETRIRDAESD